MEDNNFDEVIAKLDGEQVWDFPGGIFPAERKNLSNQTPIEKLPLPKRLYVTVKQHIGVEGHLIVEPGQSVLKGQALTKSMNPFAVPIHAPTSGTIVSIDQHVSAHPSGLPELTVEIESDQMDTWAELTPMQDYQSHPKIKVLGAICDAGVSGMGGAGFPTHIKSSPKKDVDFLIINGIECEPYITSDDRLMREHAWQIRQGIDVLCHLLSPKQVLIGIENNKPEAIEAMQVACRENPNYRICSVPTKYPAGGEKQLIQVLTNREVPASGLPVDVGIIMHNVGTCFAVADAVLAGKPLVERVVTITGEAVEHPTNVWAPIGAPMGALLAHAKYQEAKQKRPNIIMGGPMMGYSVINDLVPVIKTTNCVLVPTDKEVSDSNEQACIRCGACADACPASLLPQQMFWHAKAKELDKAQEYNLFDCIECGACAYVCPSEIPLVHYYRIAKSDIRTEQDEKQKADKARERFEKRATRLAAEQAARDEKHRLAAEARKQAMEKSGGGAKDKIAAALARAKAKKLAASDVAKDEPSSPDAIGKQADATADGNTIAADKPATTTKSASSNQRVQAAIERAKAKKAAAEAAVKAKAPASSQESNQQNADSDMQTATPSVTADKHTQPRSAIETPKDSAEVAPKPQAIAKKADTAAIETKQAKIAAAVAKAKAKREAQKQASSGKEQEPESVTADTPSAPSSAKNSSEEQQLALKKRRIAAAVAKAKAKKAAQQKEDKSS